MTAPNTRPNPYVGPRSFQSGEKLYGRDVEIRQLMDLLISERIALLHSPSGAGKSSLIRAGLVPCLEAEGFTVLPIVRVNLEPPAEIRKLPGFNRFAYSTLVSLAEGDEMVRPVKLAGMRISEFLKKASPQEETVIVRRTPTSENGLRQPNQSTNLARFQVRRPGGDTATDLIPSHPLQRVILFDQFEEVLNVDPTDREAKHAFFRQLGDALDDPDLWALFAVREDYLPALDPYLRPVPTRLKNTFRLDLLGVDAAQQSITQPARAAGAVFEDGTARRLVDDLRKIKIQQPDGSLEEQLGPYVEPLQLQVVCFRLWEKLTLDDQRIDDDDLTTSGDVNQSLSDYYSQRVAAAAKETGVSERSIREWFDRRLITEGGMRGQVLMGQGLDLAVVRILENAHLVRGEKRGGATWYELTHDRLVGPVRRNNAAWFEANLSLLQRQAGLWDQQGRPEGVLLRGTPLAEAEAWSATHANELTAAEHDFLQACRREAAGALSLRRRTQAVMLMGVLALAAAIAAVFFAVRAEGQRNIAEAQKVVAITAQARSEDQRNIALQQQNIAEQQKKIAEEQRAAAVTAQQQALAEQKNALAAKEEAVRQGDIATLLQLYTQSGNLATRQPDLALLLSLQLNRIAAQPGLEAFHGQAYENLASVVLQQDERLYRTLRGHTGPVDSIAVTPDGKILASAGADGQVILWDPLGGTQSGRLPLKDTVARRSVVFSADGKQLAFGSDDGKVYLWNMVQSAWVWEELPAHQQRVDQVTFSPDGTLLATASCSVYDAAMSTCDTGQIKIWQIATQSALTIQAHHGWIKDLVFTADSKTLYSNGPDYLMVWDAATGNPAGPEPLDAASGIALYPDGKQLAQWGRDNVITFQQAFDRTKLLPLDDANTFNSTKPPAGPPVLRVPAPYPLIGGGVTTGKQFGVFKFGDTGKRLAMAYANNQINILDPATGGDSMPPLVGHTNKVTSLGFFGPNDRYLASSSFDSRILIWDLQAQTRESKKINGINGVWYVVPSPDETWMVSNDPNKEPKRGIRVWNLTTMKQTQVLEGPTSAMLRISPDGQWLAASGGAASSGAGDMQHGDVRLWKMPEGSLMLDSPELTGYVTGIAFSPDSKFLFAVDDKTITVWETASGKVSKTVPFSVGRGSYVAFNRDGTQIAIAYGVAVQVFTFPDLKPVGELIPHEDPDHQEEAAFSMAFSPNGKLLAIGGGDKTGLPKTIRVWDLETREQVTPPLVGHQKSVAKLLFSADNNFLVSLGYDGMVKMWDLASKGVTHPLLNEPVPDANFMMFTQDGGELHVYGNSGSINYWKIGSAYLKSVACRMANREMTEAEWKTYVSESAPQEKVCPQQ